MARVEQTETPEQMEQRCRSSKSKVTKFDKVVRRELCQVTTRGTRTFNVLEGDCCEPNSSFLMAICTAPVTSGKDPASGEKVR